MVIEQLTPKFFALNCKFIAPQMTYEHYLIEVINGSSFFYQRKELWEQFRLQDKQSNGEDDIYSSRYSMDFKLLVDQDVMSAMAKNKPSVDYSKMSQGFIFVNEKHEKIPVPQKNILLELMNLGKADFESNGLSPTITNLVNNLKKNKNLFIYYPYEFSSEHSIALPPFAKTLNAFMSEIMRFRASLYPDRDTFVCIKVNEWFAIFEWFDNTFVFRDQVHEMLCGNYRDVKLYSFY